VSYSQHDVVLFEPNLCENTISLEGNFTTNTGMWSVTDTGDPIFTQSGDAVRSFVGTTDYTTGNQVLRSNAFDIKPLSNYAVSVYIAKSSDASTSDSRRADVLQNGAGVKFAFFDENGSEIFAGVNQIETHSLKKIVDLPTTRWQKIKLDLDYRQIPQFGSVAVSGAIDLVVYGQTEGPIYFSGAEAYNKEKYFYCSSNHTATIENSPTGSSSAWSQDFEHTPSYNSSIRFRSNNATSEFGDGYSRQIHKGVNALQAEVSLRFDGLNDAEYKSISHYLENKKGYKPFYFTMPHPYNKSLPYYCETFSPKKDFSNNNSISATFLCDTQSLLTKDEIFLLESVSEDRYLDWSAQSYNTSDVVYFDSSTVSSGITGNNNYYYKKSSLLPTGTGHPYGDDHWTRNLFFWEPSANNSPNIEPRIEKANANDRYVERSSDGLHSTLLTLDLEFNNRSDQETAGILHFLEQRRGLSYFNYSPPAPHGIQIGYTGATSVITGDRGLYEYLNAGDEVLFACNTGGQTPQENKIKKIELLAGDSDPYYKSGYTLITLNKNLPSYFEVTATGESANRNRMEKLRRFRCSEWQHNYNFYNNNKISARFTEVPIRWGAPPSITIDGPVFGTWQDTATFSVDIKDYEGIASYRVYNVNSTPPSFVDYTGTELNESFGVNLTHSGVNTIRVEASNEQGVYDYNDHLINVDGQIHASIATIGTSEYIPLGGQIQLMGFADSTNFIEGYKFWWEDDPSGEPASYTDIQFTNYGLSQYNPYLTGLTDFNHFEKRSFGEEVGAFTGNLKVIDGSGQEASATKEIIVASDTNVIQIYGLNSTNDLYKFEQKYYSSQGYSNVDFKNSGDITVTVGQTRITGVPTYTWNLIETTYSNPSNVNIGSGVPIGVSWVSGNYFNFSAELTGSYPDEDTWVKFKLRCNAQGIGQNPSITLTGQKDIDVLFSWLKE
jgi:phage-related protein